MRPSGYCHQTSDFVTRPTALIAGRPMILGVLNGDSGCFFISLGLVTYFIVRAFRSKPEEVTAPGAADLPSTRGDVGSFDPFTDLRTARGIKGSKVSLMLREAQEGCAESLTLNDDFIAVGRSSAEVQAILLDEQIVIRLNLGALPQYAETRYHLDLSRGAEVAQVPVSFPGWLELFDACRKAGGTLEVADEVADQMRVIVLGQGGARRLASSSASASPKVSRPTKCPACGALLGKRGPCEYCGANV